MKIDPLGVIVLLISIGLLLMLLTRTTKEHFTSAKGTYPSWTSIAQDVKQALSKYYTYSFSEFLTYADQSTVFTSANPQYTSFVQPTLQALSSFGNLNVDLFNTSAMQQVFAEETYAPFLKGAVYDATRPYDMAVTWIQAAHALAVDTATNPDKYTKTAAGSTVVSAYQTMRTLESIAVFLRGYAYQHMFDFPNQSNVKATEK